MVRRLTQGVPDPLQVPALLEHPADGGRRALAGLGHALDLGVHVRVGRREAFLLGDGLDEQRALHRLLGPGPQVLQQLLVVPRHLVRVHPLPAHVLAGVLDLMPDLAQDQRLGHLEGVAGHDRVEHRGLQRATVVRVAPRRQPGPDLGSQRVQRLEVAPHRLGELVVERGQHLLLHLGHRHGGLRRLAAQRLAAVVVAEAHPGLARAARGQADHRLLHLGQHAAAPDDEAVAGLGAGLLALGSERVVHDHEVAGIGGALDRAVLRVLLLQRGERLVHLAVREGLGGVLDREAGVGPQGDDGLDLDHRGELQRRVLLERDLLQIGLLHRLDARLGEGLAVHVGDQVAGHFLPHVVREVQLDHAARDLALAESGKLCLALHAIEGLLPGLRHHLGGLLDLQPPLAARQLFDLHLHGSSTFMATPRFWCERGELNPHGLPLWILSPARLPVPPLSHDGSRVSRCGEDQAKEG